MESSTSSYRNTLQLLLQRLSIEVDQKNSYANFPDISNATNSKQLMNAIKKVDSLLASNDLNINHVGTSSYDDFDPSTDPLSMFQLIINGYSVSTLAFMGIILNTAGIWFLSTGPRRGTILGLLVSALLTFDAIFLLFEMFKSLECWLITIPRKYFKTYVIIVSSGTRCSMIASIFMLVAIARVRLCAIKNPFQLNNALLSWEERRNYCLRYCIPVVISAALLTIPQYFEIGDDFLEPNDSDFGVAPTNLKLHPLFSLLYIGVLNLGILGFLPMVYLAYLDNQIRKELKKNEEQRSRLSNHSRTGASDASSDDDKNTRGLLAIIVAFIAFHAFRVLITIGEIDLLLFHNNFNNDLKNGRSVPNWLAISFSLNELLLVINASVNVVIYLKSNAREFLKILMSRRREQSNKLKYVAHYRKHHRKMLKKKVSDDAIVTIDRKEDNVETNTIENTHEENDMRMSVNKGTSDRSTRSNSIFDPFRMNRLKCLSEDPSYDILDTEKDADSKVVIKRRSSMGIMDDV